MFRGRSIHILDGKGRVAIPARFKEVLNTRGEDSLVITNEGNTLWAFCKADWTILEEKAAKLSQFDKSGVVFLRYFISGAEECRLKNNRITIPKKLRDDAGLKKEVVLVGELKRFEIWDKDKWDEEFERVKTSFAEAAESLPELSI